MTASKGSGAVEVGYRRVVLRVGEGRWTVRRRSLVVGLCLLLVIGALGVSALGWGTYPVSPVEVVRALTGGGEAMAGTVVREWRLPRVGAAIVLGALLAVAGALFQTVTRNPLASPDVLGLSNGAFCGMLLTVVFVSTSWPVVTAGAIAGGLVTALVIWVLSVRAGVQGFRLIVIGIGVAAMLASLNTWMLLEVELDTAMFASAWGAGTLNGVAAGPTFAAAACALPLLLLVAAVAPRLRQLELGDDVASATGARPSSVRTVALLTGVGLVSVATAVIGPVAFIALAAPQIARRVARTPSIPFVLSGLVGAGLLLVADVIAQHVVPVSLPAGVATVSLGGLYLVVTLVQEIRRRA